MVYNFGLRPKIKNIIAHYPALHQAARRLKTHDLYVTAHDVVMSFTSHQNIFDQAYKTRAWGSAESGSGEGSEMAATAIVRTYLPELFKRLGITTFLDAPCGDWNWMRQVDLADIDYIGADVVPDVIADNQRRYGRDGVRFILADLTRDSLPHSDLILCRDCWIHLSYKDISAMLENFRRSGATWLLTTDGPWAEKNSDQLTGLRWRPLNLTLPPFNFPAPAEARKDHYPDVPFNITLWRLSDLPRFHM